MKKPEQLCFNCSNCGKFITTKWEPLAGGMASTNCPNLECGKFIMQARTAVLAANVPKKPIPQPPIPFSYTQNQMSKSHHVKKSVSKSKKPLTESQQKILNMGVVPIQIRMFDMYLKGYNTKEIMEATEFRERYVRVQLGILKRTLLGLEYAPYSIDSLTVMEAYKAKGLDVNMDRWNEQRSKRRKLQGERKTQNCLKRKREKNKNRAQRILEMSGHDSIDERPRYLDKLDRWRDKNE